jgi:pimeloyl-ACP methyl ester carboxylesterase
MEPTLFMRGSTSHYVKDSDIAHINEVFSNAQIDTIEGAGHWVQAEQPEAFVTSLVNFLK